MHDTHKFKCAKCGASIIPDRSESGVNNRNHCPHCLWSLHVDDKTPGDRRSGCKSRMEPIGVTAKQSNRRYNRGIAGELMLIHRCLGCGKLSINRIAADDNAAVIHQVYQRSLGMSLEERQSIQQAGILLLTERDVTTIFSQLYGWQSILEEFTPDKTVGEVVMEKTITEDIVHK
jgi:DNA-directed RNA polymerase subunit RPC12/RpoP